MKSKLLRQLVLGSLTATSVSFAEIQLTDTLTAEGFLDMSVLHKSTDSDDSTSVGFDQFEIDLHFKPTEGVSARVDLDSQPSSDQSAVEVEQAFVVATLAEGFSLKAGKFLSSLGYEAAEPTAMYQYSYSATVIGYPGYANGIGVGYDAGTFKINVSVVDGAYTSDGDADSVSPEIQLVVNPLEGLTLQAGYTYQEFDATTNELGETVPGYNKGIANFWAEYKTGGLTLAVEFNQLFDVQGADSDGTGYLVMANYDWGTFGLTLRHSAVDLDNGYEHSEFTISPNIELAANLTAVFEVRFDDYKGDSSEDSVSYAAELLYVF